MRSKSPEVPEGIIVFAATLPCVSVKNSKAVAVAFTRISCRAAPPVGSSFPKETVRSCIKSPLISPEEKSKASQEVVSGFQSLSLGLPPPDMSSQI